MVSNQLLETLYSVTAVKLSLRDWLNASANGMNQTFSCLVTAVSDYNGVGSVEHDRTE